MNYKKRQLRSKIKTLGIKGAWVKFLPLTTELHIFHVHLNNNNFYVALIPKAQGESGLKASLWPPINLATQTKLILILKS